MDLSCEINVVNMDIYRITIRSDRPLDKNAELKINLHISQVKHVLWVLIGNVSDGPFEYQEHMV